jgi:Raf kinase inhibitor-like YbhB/YbcL family protein
MKRKFVYLIHCCFVVLSLLMVSCNTAGTRDEGVSSAIDEDATMTIALSSTAFKEGDKIPVKYTCDGQDISPALIWDEPPQPTEAFVLIVDDPDAPGGVFTHWILFNIPANIHQFGEGVPTQEQLENGTLQGRNDFGRISYGGPCPPSGSPHRYRFTIYALDQHLNLEPGASENQVVNAMQEHILAQGQLTGTYQR